MEGDRFKLICHSIRKLQNGLDLRQLGCPKPKLPKSVNIITTGLRTFIYVAPEFVVLKDDLIQLIISSLNPST